MVIGVGIRGKLKRLERDARGSLESFRLEDGSRFYFDPMGVELFLHSMDCLRAQGTGEPFPEPPEVVKAIARAKNREVAYHQVRSGASWDLFPYDVEALVERGEIVPRSLVHAHKLGEGPLLDLSEQAKASEASGE
jgi:hypothetical protein